MQPAASKAPGPVWERNWEGIAGGTQGDGDGLGASAQRVVWCRWGCRRDRRRGALWDLFSTVSFAFALRDGSVSRCLLRSHFHPRVCFPFAQHFLPADGGETRALRGPRATAALCAPLPSISAAAAENSTVLLLPFGSSPCLLVEVSGSGAEPLHKEGVLAVLDGGDPCEHTGDADGILVFACLASREPGGAPTVSPLWGICVEFCL